MSKYRLVSIVNILLFLVTVVVNGLANALPLNGRQLEKPIPSLARVTDSV